MSKNTNITKRIRNLVAQQKLTLDLISQFSQRADLASFYGLRHLAATTRNLKLKHEQELKELQDEINRLRRQRDGRI
jgi:hypothetical protein